MKCLHNSFVSLSTLILLISEGYSISNVFVGVHSLFVVFIPHSHVTTENKAQVAHNSFLSGYLDLACLKLPYVHFVASSSVQSVIRFLLHASCQQP